MLIIGTISDSRTEFHNPIMCDMSHVSVRVCVQDQKCLCNNEKKMADSFIFIFVVLLF